MRGCPGLLAGTAHRGRAVQVLLRAVLVGASVRASKCSSRLFDTHGVRSVLGIASVASHCTWELGVKGREVNGEA